MRRIVHALLGLALAACFYLLLIDTTDSPELYAGAGAVLLAAGGFELAREQRFAEGSLAARSLRRSWRVLERAPVEIVLVSWAALEQLIVRKPTRGVFRAIPFDAGGERSEDAGRRALAEALGSLTPNTIVVGIDPENDLLLAHQLRRSGAAEELDPLELG